MSAFTDPFGHVPQWYARYRPVYPPAMFAELAARAPARDLVWDVGTGNGQAAGSLAEHFARVVASDASRGQLAHAARDDRVAYLAARAEAAAIHPAAVQLITVAQALHWFDLSAFYAEVRRVLAPRGILAAWCYGVLSVEPSVDAIVGRFARETIGPYWGPGHPFVAAGYRTIAFPFQEIPFPTFTIETCWTLEQVLGHVRTWSGTTGYAAAHGDPLPQLARQLDRVWGAPEVARPVRWPLHVRIGRVSGRFTPR